MRYLSFDDYVALALLLLLYISLVLNYKKIHMPVIGKLYFSNTLFKRYKKRSDNGLYLVKDIKLLLVFKIVLNFLMIVSGIIIVIFKTIWGILGVELLRSTVVEIEKVLTMISEDCKSTESS